MKSKPGCAIIEFTETDAVTKATKLTGAELFGNKLTLRPSKSMFVGEPKGETFDLPGGLPAYKDFTNSKFNRFSTAEKASKNRDQIPRATVHFFNAPVDCDEKQLTDMIASVNESLGLHPSRNPSKEENEDKEIKQEIKQEANSSENNNNRPTDTCDLEIENVIIFPKKEKSKSTAGLITFKTIEQAMNCLAKLNHKSMETRESAYPYNVKFCFATQDYKAE